MMKNPNGRWSKLTPRLARIALLMREHRNSKKVGDALGITRENVCTSIRAAEFFLGSQLFTRLARVHATDWGVINTPDTAPLWKTLESLSALGAVLDHAKGLSW